MTNPTYSTAMWLLYATGRLLISNCRRKLADFAEFSTAYTDGLLDSILELVDRAGDSAQSVPVNPQ